MPLDPQARMLLDTIKQLDLPDITTLAPEAAREFSAKRTRGMPPGPDAAVTEHTVAGPSAAMPVRSYRPLGSDAERLPAVVYFHGGGFVLGSIDQCDADCRRIATGANCAVFNVEYPLAPESRFPEPPEACFAALRWVAEHADALGIDDERIAVAGDSAGANLATVTCAMARDRGGPAIVYQALIYPVTDLANFETVSHRENAEGYYLTRALLLWFTDHYLRSTSDASHEHASPLRNPDLRGLPPALVITAEFDPLRDEGHAYAQRLQEAGVPTVYSPYAGMIHGFVTMSPYLDAGKRATTEVIEHLRTALHGQST